jgi:hypothetical protein
MPDRDSVHQRYIYFRRPRYAFLDCQMSYPLGPSIYLPIGRGRPGETCSIDCHNNNDPPVKCICNELKAVFPTWKTHLPPDDNCCLTATDNIFGRLVNAAPGASDDSVCTTKSKCRNVSGEFAHIDQQATSRDAANYVGWAKAISNAFAASSRKRLSNSSTLPDDGFQRYDIISFLECQR